MLNILRIVTFQTKNEIMKNSILILFILSMTITACSQKQASKSSNIELTEDAIAALKSATDVRKIEEYIADKDYSNYKVATFAGGCFWCTEAAFERIDGVVDVISGYTGGKELYPTYEQVGRELTTHTEGIQIYYDENIVSFQTLLDVLFVAHDPTTLNRQGPDRGPQYRSGIYYHNEAQKEAIDKTIASLTERKVFNNPIVTEVAAYEEFWTAEKYHQDYYEHNPQNPYVARVSRPKVEKVKKVFKDKLKQQYKQTK